MALKTSDVVEERATAPIYSDIDMCQAPTPNDDPAAWRVRGFVRLCRRVGPAVATTVGLSSIDGTGRGAGAAAQGRVALSCRRDDATLDGAGVGGPQRRRPTTPLSPTSIWDRSTGRWPRRSGGGSTRWWPSPVTGSTPRGSTTPTRPTFGGASTTGRPRYDSN